MSSAPSAYVSSDLRTRRSIATGGLAGGPGSGSTASPASSTSSLGAGWGSAASTGSGWGSASGYPSQDYGQGGFQYDRPPPPDRDGGHGNSSSGGMSPTLRGTFALLLLTAICLHADQNLAAPNLSAIANDFQMTPMQKDTRLGGMVQFGFFLIGGAVSLLVGPATDQVDRVTLLSAVVLSGSVPSLCMSLWVPSSKAGFFYFFLARICTGIAIGGSFPVLFALAADVFPPSQRAFVSTCISAATNIGAAVGGLMAGVVGPRFGWRVPFRLVAIPALVCAVLVRALLVDPRTVRRQKKAKQEAATLQNSAFAAWTGGQEAAPSGYVRMEELDFTKFVRILDVKTNVLVFAQSLPGCMPVAVIVTFMADYLAVEQGMAVQASTAVTAVFGVSCLCFAVSGGIFGQRLYNRRKDRLPVLIGAAQCFAAIPFMILVNSPKTAVTAPSGRPTLLALLLALLGGAAGTAGPNIRAILMNVNDSEVRGTVFSALTLFDDLGKGVGPSVIVAATAMIGRRAAYTLAFALWWLSGAILMSMSKQLPVDAARGGGSYLPFKSK